MSEDSGGIPKHWKRPQDLIEATEQAWREAKAREHLPRTAESALMLKAYIGLVGLSYPEAADLLDISLPTLKAKIANRMPIARSEIIFLAKLFKVVRAGDAIAAKGLPVPESVRQRAAGIAEMDRFWSEHGDVAESREYGTMEPD